MPLPSVILLMSQLPHDPASGAPRSDKTICEFLAAEGFHVRALATTATEHANPEGPLEFLHRAGMNPRVEQGAAACGERPVYRFTDRKIEYTILDVTPHAPQAWLHEHNNQYNALLRALVHEKRPDIVECYGGQPEERDRRTWLRREGATIIFHLHNWGYLDPGAFHDVDAVMTPSRFLSERYHQAIGLESTPMPIPIIEEDVLALRPKPKFVTFINPSVDKGVCIVARICEEICRKRDDIPFLIVNARRTAATLVKIALAGGFDLRRHQSIVYSEGVPRPRDIYEVTKVLLVPSVWQEPAGRVAAEAIANGIPPIVSHQGGTPETLHGGGYILPLPASATKITDRPVPAHEVADWVQLIELLFDDPDEYATACWRARGAANRHYKQEIVARAFVDFFQSVKRRSSPLISS